MVQVHVAGKARARIHQAGQRQSGAADGIGAPDIVSERRGGHPRQKACPDPRRVYRATVRAVGKIHIRKNVPEDLVRLVSGGAACDQGI